MTELAKLLEIIGRRPDEPCTILSQPAGGTGLSVEWTTVRDAPGVAAAHAGKESVWFGVQPVRASAGRGKAADVTSLVTLYADLDFATAGKPGGMSSPVAFDVMSDLSNTLGVGPAAIVASGGGIQPYWPTESMDPLSGAQLLLWWREQVIRVAGSRGVKVDTGVYDLARILRVPGPPNMKAIYGTAGASTKLIVPGGGGRISVPEVRERITLHPAAGPGTRAGRNTDITFGSRGGDDSDRVFTPEQAAAYLARADGPVAIAKNTPHGAGFNDALNRACFEIAAFVPVFLSEDEAWDLACSVVEAQFPGGPDGNDVGTIRSGFAQQGWVARAPTLEEATNPFGNYADVKRIVESQGGLRVATPVGARALASRQTVAAADAAVSAVMNAFSDSTSLPVTEGMGDHDGIRVVTGEVDNSEIDRLWKERVAEQESRGYFLPDEFWNETEIRALAHIREAARAARVSPEGVLLAVMSEIAVRIPPNVKIPDFVKTMASLSFGVILAGESGSNKSSSVDLAQELFIYEHEAAAAQNAFALGVPAGPHYFGLQSPQGIPGQYQHYEKPRGAPGFMKTDRFMAMADEDEGDKIASLCEKDGLGLVSAIRSALMGKLLGAGNVGETKTNLPKHSYRFVMRICTLPAHCAWILADDVGGLPQRLIWACVEDSRIVRASAPGKFPLRFPLEMTLNDDGSLRPEMVLTADEEVRAEIIRDQDLRDMLGVGELDEHALLTREKVAWILAALGGGSHVRHGVEWRLAGMVMAASNASRSYVQARVAEARAENDRVVALKKGKNRIIEESVVGVHAETKDRQRATEGVLRYLGRNKAQGLTKGELRNKLKVDIRHLLDDGVLDSLLDTGQVRFEDILEHGRQVGSRWFLN